MEIISLNEQHNSPRGYVTKLVLFSQIGPEVLYAFIGVSSLIACPAFGQTAVGSYSL
jgi:hypothetical protein